MNGKIHCAALLLLASGCATAIPAEEDGLVSRPALPKEMTDANQDAVDASLDAMLPPGDQGASPSPDMQIIPEECQPLTRLGLCVVCSVDGEPEVPDDDLQCSEIDCSQTDSYTRVDEGENVVCMKTASTPGPSRCQALGACFNDPAVYCVEGDAPVETVREVGPCQTMEGCLGIQPGNIVNEPDGADCLNGTCDGMGICVPDEPDCTPFEADAAHRVLCDTGDNPPYCEIFVEQGGGTSCNNFCLRNGSLCIDGWNDVDGSCQRGNHDGCNGDLSTQICRCEAL